MSFKHSAVLPGGEVAKRVSQNRQYSHCIAGRRLYEVDLAAAKKVSNADYDNYRFYKGYLDGSSQWLARRDYERDEARYHERVAREKANAVEQIGDFADASAYAVAKRDKRVAQVEADKAAGRYDRWVSLGWSSRLDLAQKASGQYSGHYAIQIVPAVIA